MSNWLISRQGVFWISLAALLLFVGRTFYDYRFEALKQDPEGSSMLLSAVVNLVFLGGWMWALAAGRDGSRPALITLIVLNLLLNVVLGVATFFVFCPPGCEGWPTWQFWNWGQLIGGLAAVIAAGLLFRKGQRS